MPVITGARPSLRSRIAWRGTLALGGLALVGALSVATLLNPRVADAVGDGLNSGIRSVQTVAAMLAERSPGERPEGALANLKPKREAALHARALPKIRAPSPTPYETLAGPPPTPPAPPEAPLYNMVAGGPQAVVPPTAAVVTPGMPGGPPVLSNIPTPGGGGGGGGGVFSPPVVTATPETPTTPLTPTPPSPPSAVPEPATWGLMLLGFALIGRALRRRRYAGPSPALD